MDQAEEAKGEKYSLAQECHSLVKENERWQQMTKWLKFWTLQPEFLLGSGSVFT